MWKGRGPAHSHAETEYRLTAVDGGTRFAYRNVFKAPLGALGALASRALVGGLPEREAQREPEEPQGARREGQILGQRGLREVRRDVAATLRRLGDAERGADPLVELRRGAAAAESVIGAPSSVPGDDRLR